MEWYSASLMPVKLSIRSPEWWWLQMTCKLLGDSETFTRSHSKDGVLGHLQMSVESEAIVMEGALGVKAKRSNAQTAKLGV